MSVAAERLAELNEQVAAAERVKSLPALKRERDAIAAKVEAEHLAEAEAHEAAVQAYETARIEYAALQERLVASLPDFCDFIESVRNAKTHQELALRAAEKVSGHDLIEKTQTIATRSSKFDEPFRSVHDRWIAMRKLDV